MKKSLIHLVANQEYTNEEMAAKYDQIDADLKWFVTWGKQPCPHFSEVNKTDNLYTFSPWQSKRECGICWEELEKLAGE